VSAHGRSVRERVEFREFDRDLARSASWLAERGGFPRSVAVRIACRFRGIDPVDLDRRAVDRFVSQRGPAWLTGTLTRPVSRPTRARVEDDDDLSGCRGGPSGEVPTFTGGKDGQP
jgi:hypothetical protein